MGLRRRRIFIIITTSPIGEGAALWGRIGVRVGIIIMGSLCSSSGARTISIVIVTIVVALIIVALNPAPASNHNHP